MDSRPRSRGYAPPWRRTTSRSARPAESAWGRGMGFVGEVGRVSAGPVRPSARPVYSGARRKFVSCSAALPRCARWQFGEPRSRSAVGGTTSVACTSIRPTELIDHHNGHLRTYIVTRVSVPAAARPDSVTTLHSSVRYRPGRFQRIPPPLLLDRSSYAHARAA